VIWLKLKHAQKCVNFIKKSKKSSSDGALPPNHYASGDWGLCPQTPALALRHYSIPECALNYKTAISRDIKMELNKNDKNYCCYSNRHTASYDIIHYGWHFKTICFSENLLKRAPGGVLEWP